MQMAFKACLFALLLFSYQVQAQEGQGKNNDHDAPGSELCVYTGFSFYIGDINPTGYYKYQDPAGGIGYRYNFNKRFSFRVNGMVDKVHASDADSRDPVQRDRNLSFYSWIEELSGQFEFNFLPFRIGSRDKFCPYIFVGLGGFHFNPRAKLGNQYYNLQPLATEGEGTAADPGSKKYALESACIPFGMGFKWSITKRIGIGFESGMRKTYTQYLDDVSGVYPDASKLPSALSAAFSNRSISFNPNFNYTGRQRGDGNTDWYNYTGIVISIKLPQKPPKCAGVGK